MIKKAIRFLSVLLVLANLLSFIPTVAMADSTSTGSTDNEYGGASGTAGKGDSVTLNYAGGYRVYLTQSCLISDNLDEGGLHFNENGEFTFRSTDYLNRYKNYAIYEVTGVGGGRGDNEKYAIGINSGKALYSYNWTNTDCRYTSCTVLRDSVGADKSNQSPDFAELVDGLTVDAKAKSFIPWQSNNSDWATKFKNWANGVFNADDFDYKKFLSNYKSILNADGRSTPSWFPESESDFISNKFAIVVEPVVVVKLQGGIHYCFSAQDYFSKDKNSLYSTRSTDTSFSHNDNHGFCNSAKSLYNIFFEYTRNVTKNGSTTEVEIGTEGTKEAGYGIYKSADQIINGGSGNGDSGKVATSIVVNAGTVKDTDNLSYAVGEAGTFEGNENYDANSVIYRSTFLSKDTANSDEYSVSTVQTLLDSCKKMKNSTNFTFNAVASGNSKATADYTMYPSHDNKEKMLVESDATVVSTYDRNYPQISGVRPYISNDYKEMQKVQSVTDFANILKLGGMSNSTRVISYQLFAADVLETKASEAFLRSLIEAHASVKTTKSVVSGGVFNFGNTYSPSLVNASPGTYSDSDVVCSGENFSQDYTLKDRDRIISSKKYSPFKTVAIRSMLNNFHNSVRGIFPDAVLDVGYDDAISFFLEAMYSYCDSVYKKGVGWDDLRALFEDGGHQVDSDLKNSICEYIDNFTDEWGKSYLTIDGNCLYLNSTNSDECRQIADDEFLRALEYSIGIITYVRADNFVYVLASEVTPEVDLTYSDYTAFKSELSSGGVVSDRDVTEYILSALTKSAMDASRMDNSFAGVAVEDKNRVGIAVALTASTAPVKSQSAVYTVTDNGGTWSSTSSYNYTSESIADIALPDTEGVPNSYVVVIPRFGKTLDNGLKDTIQTTFSEVTDTDPASVALELKEKLSDSTVRLLGDIEDKDSSEKLTIKVGSEGNKDGTLVGYDVIYILDKRTDARAIQSTMTLRDYELNYVYETLLGESKDVSLINTSLTKFANVNATLTKDNSTYNLFGTHTETGNSYGHEWAGVFSCSSDVRDSTYKALSIIKSEDYGGQVLDAEKNNKSVFKNVLYNTSLAGVGIFDIEANDTKMFDSSDKSITLNHTVNLRRSDFSNDKTHLSSFFGANYADAILQGNSSNDVGASEVLQSSLESRLGLPYDNKPNIVDKVSHNSAAVNTSGYVLDSAMDNYIWNVTMDCTQLLEVACNYKEVGSDAVYTETICIPANVAAFTNGRSTATYNVSENCYKYLALERNVSSVVNKKIDTETEGSRGDLAFNATFNAATLKYRSATVFSASDSDLKFYPEIEMTAYYINDTDTINSTDAVAPISMYVMGELVRRVKPSGLNILTLNPTSTSGVGGTVTSTSFASGTSADALSSNNEGIPVASGGINVDVSAGLKDALDLNISGFYLDVIDRDLDTDTAIQAGSANSDSETVFKSYNEIVARDTDTDSLRKTWGNSYSAVSAFDSWTASVKDSLSADIALQTYDGGAQETYVDSIASPDLTISGGTSADVLASYPLMIANGELVTSAIEGVSAYYTEYTEKAANSYDALIKAIAMKYYSVGSDDVTNDMRSKAEEIFKNSGLYQSICKAIESINDDDNNSTKKLRSNGEADLTGERWYDEQVRTIVVREYGYTGDDALVVNDVIANTKVDYSLVPSMGASQTEDYSVGYRARWFLTVYLKEGVLGYEGSSYFDPTSSGTRDTAETDGTVLINATPIFNADFMIGNAVTSGMIN